MYYEKDSPSLFMNTHPIHRILSRFLLMLSLFSLSIFLFPKYYLFFGSIGWWALIALLFLRPLADIFPKENLFAKMMFLRKSLGVFSGMFLLAHGIGFFFRRKSFPSKFTLSLQILESEESLWLGNVRHDSSHPSSRYFKYLFHKTSWKELETSSTPQLSLFPHGSHTCCVCPKDCSSPPSFFRLAPLLDCGGSTT